MRVLLFIILALSFSAKSIAHSDIKIVTTIKPIYSIVSNITKGVAEPALLITGNVSPHNFSLKPSQKTLLNHADLIIKIGPNLETAINNTVLSNSKPQEVIDLMATKGLDYIKTSTDGHGHAHIYLDPHIWLNPQNVIKMTDVITKVLSKLDHHNAFKYQNNAKELIEKLKNLDANITKKLTNFKDKPFLVYHDAYNYYAEHYGLNLIASVTTNHHLPPSAKRLIFLHNLIKQENIHCIFSEKNSNDKVINNLITNTKASATPLDPLGFDLKDDENLYFQLMINLTDNIIACFEGK